MGLFDIFKSQGRRPDLLESLLQAAESRDFQGLATLCGKNQEEIRKSFAAWSTVPEIVRKNSTAMARYAEGLIAIAQTFEQSGDASLISHLMKKDSENPVVQWQTNLAEAQSLLDDGKLSEAITLLQSVLSKNASLLGGTAVDEYLPKTFGMLGAAYFRSGEKDRAVECMSKAKSLCEQTGDTDGVKIYEGNLQHLATHA